MGSYRPCLPPDPVDALIPSAPDNDNGPGGANAKANTTPSQESHRRFEEIVCPAFWGVTARLEPILGERWLGCAGRIQELLPACWAAMVSTEREADRAAASFMESHTDAEAFLEAIAKYENAWRIGAEAYARHLHLSEIRPVCESCRATDATTLVVDDEFRATCTRCRIGRKN